MEIIKLKEIEKEIEGNEYFDGGVSYYIAVDEIDNSISLETAVKQYLIQIKAIKQIENIRLSKIDNPISDIQKISDEWHFEEDICKALINVICTAENVYSCCDDFEYISYGSVGSIFRIIEMRNKHIVIEFYITD